MSYMVGDHHWIGNPRAEVQQQRVYAVGHWVVRVVDVIEATRPLVMVARVLVMMVVVGVLVGGGDEGMHGGGQGTAFVADGLENTHWRTCSKSDSGDFSSSNCNIQTSYGRLN